MSLDKLTPSPYSGPHSKPVMAGIHRNIVCLQSKEVYKEERRKDKVGAKALGDCPTTGVIATVLIVGNEINTECSN